MGHAGHPAAGGPRLSERHDEGHVFGAFAEHHRLGRRRRIHRLVASVLLAHRGGEGVRGRQPAPVGRQGFGDAQFVHGGAHDFQAEA